MVQVATVFPESFREKKDVRFKTPQFRRDLYNSASFLCANQIFHGVVDLLKLFNQSKTANIWKPHDEM